MANGGWRDAEALRNLARVSKLSMQVCKHHPEPPERGGGNPDPPIRDVTLEVGLNESVPPVERLPVRAC